MAGQPQSQLSIRSTKVSDSRALSRICLLTGDAGKSAEPLHSIPELIGLFYACPYISLPYSGGFALVRECTAKQSQSQPSSADTGAGTDVEEGRENVEDILGYMLFAYDTRGFEDALEREWFPPLREKYPDLTSEDASEGVYANTPLTDADKRYIKLLHAPDRAPQACVAFSPAHLHIDILPEAQRQGWGRRLIDSAVRYLRDEKGLKGVWMGMDPRNVDAARFYERLGFEEIEGAPSNYLGLKFEKWKSI